MVQTVWEDRGSDVCVPLLGFPGSWAWVSLSSPCSASVGRGMPNWAELKFFKFSSFIKFSSFRVFKFQVFEFSSFRVFNFSSFSSFA